MCIARIILSNSTSLKCIIVSLYFFKDANMVAIRLFGSFIAILAAEGLRLALIDL